jgi:hypothetical protein
MLALAGVLALRVAAQQRLVNFDGCALTTHRETSLAHCFVEPMSVNQAVTALFSMQIKPDSIRDAA